MILKPTKIAQVLLKNGTRDFQNKPPCERFACFYVTISGNFFNTAPLKQIFWKTETFFKQLEYSFSVESTNIERALFPSKTVVSEANVKKHRNESTK